MGIFSKDEDSTYIIVEAITSPSLMKKVNKKLEEGYVCQGGVSEYSNGFNQAMIKEKK